MKVKDLLKTVKVTTRFTIFTSENNKLTNWDEDEKETILFKSWNDKINDVKKFHEEEVIQIRPTSRHECGHWVLDIQIKNK